MTTTCESCSPLSASDATTYVTAQYLDPDRDEDGYVPGWSDAVTTAVCEDCLNHLRNDTEYVSICEEVDI